MSSDSRSLLDRSARPPDLTAAYGDLPDQVVDVWLPVRRAEPAGAPLLVFLHGGFWRAEYDRAHVAPVAEAFADLGYIVATPEYRRTGQGGGWPETFDDVLAGLEFLPRWLGGDRRVVVAGHSAGGHLALWAAAQPRTRSAVDLAGVVALAAVCDLRAAYDLNQDDGAVRVLLGGGPEQFPERFEAADPMRLLPLSVPVALVHGDRDLHVPVSFSQRYAEAARAAGDTVQLYILAEIEHFALIDPESPAWPTVVAAVGSVPPG